MNQLTAPLAIVASLAIGAQAGPARRSPADLARDLQAKYERIQSFSADFEHVYEGGVLRKKVSEHGTVVVRKPGQMRWTYTTPEKKEFVSDGRKLYSYIPDDKQVIVSPVPPADEASSPALFLAGKGSITRDFNASAASVPGLGPDEEALQLVPRKPQEEYDWLVLVVARGSLALRRLVTTDAQGGTSTFVFSRFRENVPLPADAFVFKIPRGVEVIDGSRSR
jgi:outer membrane lipoprotein carrier protein